MTISGVMVLFSVSVAPVTAGEELAVDEPLDANASQNVRPADAFQVDRSQDLFVDPSTVNSPRQTAPPSTRQVDGDASTDARPHARLAGRGSQAFTNRADRSRWETPVFDDRMRR